MKQINQQINQLKLCHSGANRNPVTMLWIPAFTGMTGKIAHHMMIAHLLVIWVAILFVMPLPLSADQSDCGKATELVQQAYDMGTDSYSRQKELLHEAIRLCPDHPEAHNNLGSILETEKAYDEALFHYRKAVSARPDFAAAWFGMGEVYSKTGKIMMAADAYVKGCSDPDARKKAKELIDSQRYRTVEQGEIADAQSLEILFDRKRRDEFREIIKNCGSKAVPEPEFIFRNILFDTGSADLKSESIAQIQEIASALQSVKNATVIISGHTDRQPFKGHSQEQSDQMNMQLSEDRAASVAKALAQRGISAERIQTNGCGPTVPIEKGDTPEAYAKNRRVVIEVRE